MEEILSIKTKYKGGRKNPNRLLGITPTDYMHYIGGKLLNYS
jgi:hypothetical protein